MIVLKVNNKMVYTNQHKILLQTLMHNGLLNETNLKDLIIKLFDKDDISVVINEINEQLQPINMLIKKAQCEITGEVYWVFMSVVLDNVTRFQEEFSKGQLALLRNIFSDIITSSDGYIQSTVCLNYCSLPDVKLSKSDVEEFLVDIVNRKWLAYKNGYYYMGVRSIIELMPYFRATYESNLSTCCLCKQIIFHGEKCNNCESLLHLYCLKRYAMVHKFLKCPNCDTPFPEVDLSGIIDNSTTLMNENEVVQKKSTKKDSRKGRR